MVKTIVIVPYRADRGHRDKLWRFLQTKYWPRFDYPIVIGTHEEGPFNRAKAINDAATGDWDYAIITDADTWVPETQMRQAETMARATGKLAAAFTAVVEINRNCTAQILRGKVPLEGSFDTDRVRTRPLETQSSMLIVPRPLWDSVGGFDERFAGYGAEDNAFFHACTVHAGQPQRAGGNAYHLWHPPAPDKFVGPDYRRNQILFRRMQQATTVEQLRAI